MQDLPRLDNAPDEPGFRQQTHRIIFGHKTPLGLIFDLGLLVAIVISIIVVCIETLPELTEYRRVFLTAEVIFTFLFSIEYGLRLWCVKDPAKYAFSFFGIVDLIAVLPSFIGIILYVCGVFTTEQIVSGTGSYAVIRSFRLLRVFRLLRIGKLDKESAELATAIWKARSKVIVFLLTVIITVIIVGTIMYEIEGLQEGSEFKSIPEGIYWAIVTMTTVGYGDIVPKTIIGRFVSSLLILIGYSLIIVPTGFVSAEVIGRKRYLGGIGIRCPECRLEDHGEDAVFCRRCGERVEHQKEAPKEDSR